MRLHLASVGKGRLLNWIPPTEEGQQQPVAALQRNPRHGSIEG